MKEGKEKYNYSAEDIRNYLEGRLSARDMQALEKAALEDPFLSDAIEGMQESLHPTAAFETDLKDLNKRLRDRVSEKKKKTGILVIFSNWKIAASILLLIGTAVFTVRYLDNTQERTIAKGVTKNEAGKKPTLPVLAPADTLAAAKTNSPSDKLKLDSGDLVYQPPVIEKRSRTEKAPAKLQSETDVTTPSVSKSESAPLLAEPVKEKESVSAFSKKDVTSPTPSPLQISDTVLSGRAAGVQVTGNNRMQGNFIQGMVTDSSNGAVIGASVKISGSKTETTTDKDGYFKMYLKNAKTSEEIVINSVGFDPLIAKISSDSSRLHTFKLNPSSQSLNEVVVSGYTRSEESENSNYYRKEKEPVQDPLGWDSLITYINTNKKSIATDSLLKGEEIISFIVNKKGELSSFKIIKSLSPAHDAEIIALIKSGPALKILKGKKQKCRISIRF